MSCRPDLGRSLNTDEAAALGAVYQAAGQTKLFRVKKFIVKDANVLPIVVYTPMHCVMDVHVSIYYRRVQMCEIVGSNST